VEYQWCFAQIIAKKSKVTDNGLKKLLLTVTGKLPFHFIAYAIISSVHRLCLMVQ